jgi:exodeoxyribonuclease VII small subunit
MTTTAAAMKDVSFEEALAELETIVRDLESGKTTLEKSIAAYERGMTLKNHCESKLREAQARIEKIVISPDGSIGVAPLDPDAAR